MRGIAFGQGGFVQHFVRCRIGQRHLRRRHQPPAIGGLIAVFAKFRQFIRAIHGLVAHQNRRVHFGQAILIDMGVDHELRQGPMHPRHSAFEHHKPGAGCFGGGLKIHVRGHARDLIMLLGLEIEFRQIAPAVHLDVLRFICAAWHIIGRRIGNAGQHIGQLRIKLLGLALHRRHFGLFVRHKRAQPLKLGLVTLGLGRAHQLAGFVLFGLGGLSRADLGPPCLVQCQHLGGHRIIAPPRKGSVKKIRIFADGADVMHGMRPWRNESSGRVMPDCAAKG